MHKDQTMIEQIPLRNHNEKRNKVRSNCIILCFSETKLSFYPRLIGRNRPFSYSEKESQSNDTLLHSVEFSNVHNSDR